MTAENVQVGELLLTIPAAAKALSVSRGTVYQLMGNGALPSVKIGRSRRVERQALRELVDRNRRGVR